MRGVVQSDMRWIQEMYGKARGQRKHRPTQLPTKRMYSNLHYAQIAFAPRSSDVHPIPSSKRVLWRCEGGGSISATCS